MEVGDGLTPEALERLAREWLREDVPALDVGGMVVGSGPGAAVLWIKASGVVCGRPFFDAVFAALGCAVVWRVREGERVAVPAGGRVEAARVTGPVNRLLQGERCALNCLARTSGIATVCADLVAVAREAGWQVSK
jgi:nicotinate-nucleotide pyrophosphorylase